MVDSPIDITTSRQDLSPPASAAMLEEPADSITSCIEIQNSDTRVPPDAVLGDQESNFFHDDGFPDQLTQMLADTMAQRHLVVWRDRGWRVPVAPILEFLAAVVIELLILLAIIFIGLHGGLAGHGGRRGGQISANATAVGGILTSSAAVTSPHVPSSWHLSHQIPRPPTLPSTLHDPVALKFPHPDNSHDAIIGIPRHTDAWTAPTPEIAPRAVRTKHTSRQPTRSRGPQPSAVTHMQGRSRYSNPNAGFGPPVPLLKGQRGGQSGAGLGRGRGPADADGGIKVLAWGSQHIPLRYQVDPVYMHGTYRVWISASGRVTKVTVVKSCGHLSMDQSFINTLERTRFSPAISNGVPISSKINITLSFGSKN
jgi:TonB family protein